MPPSTIRLTLTQREDLATVCQVGPDPLLRIASKLSGASLTIRRSKVEAQFQPELSVSQAAALGRVIYGIAGTFRQSFLTPAQALDSVDTFLAGLGDGGKKPPNWTECRPALERLLTVPAVALSAKAIDISYDFERLFMAGRILTSIRPVFTEDRRDMIGSSIVQTLRLEYMSAEGVPGNISVSMDMDDIRQLKNACEQAVHKAQEAQRTIEAGCKIEAIIPGEDNNE